MAIDDPQGIRWDCRPCLPLSRAPDRRWPRRPGIGPSRKSRLGHCLRPPHGRDRRAANSPSSRAVVSLAALVLAVQPESGGDPGGVGRPPGDPSPPRQALAPVTPVLNKDEALHL